MNHFVYKFMVFIQIYVIYYMIPTTDQIIKNVSDSCLSRPVDWYTVPYHEIDYVCVTQNMSNIHSDSCDGISMDTLNCARNGKTGTSLLLAHHSFQQGFSDILLPCTPLQTLRPMSRVSICSYNSTDHLTRCDCSWQPAKNAEILSMCSQFS